MQPCNKDFFLKTLVPWVPLVFPGGSSLFKLNLLPKAPLFNLFGFMSLRLAIRANDLENNNKKQCYQNPVKIQ